MDQFRSWNGGEWDAGKKLWRQNPDWCSVGKGLFSIATGFCQRQVIDVISVELLRDVCTKPKFCVILRKINKNTCSKISLSFQQWRHQHKSNRVDVLSWRLKRWIVKPQKIWMTEDVWRCLIRSKMMSELFRSRQRFATTSPGSGKETRPQPAENLAERRLKPRDGSRYG